MKTLRSLLKSLTISDYIIGGILFLALLVIFLFLRRSNAFIPITIKVTNPDVLSSYARPSNEYTLSFVKGDIERNELGQEVAIIEDIKYIYSSRDFPVLYVTLKTKALYSPLKKQYSLKGKPVVYGQGYNFVFSNVKFEGIVVDFPGFHTSEPLVDDTLKVKAQLKEDSRYFSEVYGVLPFVADSVKVGDEVKDEEGNTIAKVLEVVNKPAKRTVVSVDGTSRTIEDPLLRDVTYTVELKIKKTARRKFYQDFLVVDIGTTIPLIFQNTSVYPTVTQILE